MAITLEDKNKELDATILEPVNQTAEPVNINPSDMVTNLWPNAEPAPSMSETGFYNTDGSPIMSAYGNANSFYSQISRNNIIDNTPSGAMSYQGYLAYNNITDPRIQYQQNLDAAKQQYATALGTYGSAGEALAQNGLVGSGYSDYLNGVAYAQQVGNQVQAQQLMAQQQAQYGQAYNNYVNDYNNGLVDANGNEITNTSDTATFEQQKAGAYTTFSTYAPASDADFNTLKQSLIAQGYDSSAIDAAYAQWQSDNAAKEKEATENNEAQVQLVVDAIKNNEISSLSFQKNFSDIRESTYNEETGTYAWDSMSSGDKIEAYINNLKTRVVNGEISEDTYHDAVYQIASDGIDKALASAKSGFLGLKTGQNKLIGMLEELSPYYADKTELTEEQHNELIDQAASHIVITGGGKYSTTFGKDGIHLYLEVDGKRVQLDMANNGKTLNPTIKSDNYVDYGITVYNNQLYYVNGKDAYKIGAGQKLLGGLSTAENAALIEVLKKAKINNG